jgi:CheY-like chemotaxis protein
MLYALRSEWQMDFVSSAPAALRRMAETEFDVLVTDIRMPEMSGIELLTEVVERYPQVIRLVLSGTVELDLTLRSAALAHQYLVKPCDAATLRGKVDHALNLRVMLGDPALKRLISRLPSLPSAPAIYLKLLEALRSPDVSVKEIGTIIEQDIGMTAKILQLVNSAFFGITRRIVTPGEAVAYLGVDAVRAFTLSASAFAQFHPDDLSGSAPSPARSGPPWAGASRR